MRNQIKVLSLESKLESLKLELEKEPDYQLRQKIKKQYYFTLRIYHTYVKGNERRY